MTDPVNQVQAAVQSTVQSEVTKATSVVSPALVQVRRGVFGWVLDQVRNHPHFIAVLLCGVAALEAELWLHRTGLDVPLLKLVGLL